MKGSSSPTCVFYQINADLTDRSSPTSDPPAQTYFLPPRRPKIILIHICRPEAVTQRGGVLTQQLGGYTKYEGFRTLDAERDFSSLALPHLQMGDHNLLQTTSHQAEIEEKAKENSG